LVSEDLQKIGFQSYVEVANFTKDEFNVASDYVDDYDWDESDYVEDYDWDDWDGNSEYGNSEYSYDNYDSTCSNHESCSADQYCDQFKSCYDCDMYANYGGVNDTFDKSTPWCNDISPPPSPPPSSPSSELNGACSNHYDCTTATHYCDSTNNCYTCDSYYYWGGAADAYDGSTAACSSISAPPPPTPTSDDCWWCIWSTSSNLGENGGDNSESASTSVAKKKKSTSALPSPSPPTSGMKSTTEKKKIKRTEQKRTPMKATNCGGEECKYLNLKDKLKQTIGTYSFCRSDDDGRTTPICRMVHKNCEYSREIHKEARSRLKKSLLPFSSLADKNLLQLTVDAQKENVVEAMVSGLKSPESIIKQWSSANLPRLTGFINVLFTSVRGLRFRQHKSTEIDTKFTSHVTNECKKKSSCEPSSQIGDGICQEVCNVPECLYDGGDCLSLDLAKDPTYILNKENGKKSDFRKYKQRGMSQIAWQAPGLANARNFSFIVNQTMDSLPNEFEYFDKEHVCGDSDSWYEYHKVEIEDAEDPRRIIDTLIYHQAMTNLLEANQQIKIPPEPSIPFPQKKNMSYSCDNFPNILAPSPYAEALSVSHMEKWLDWAGEIMDFLKDGVLSENEAFSSHYSDELGEKIEEFENKVYYPLKYARVVKLATENSGSLYDLNLDASLTKLPNEKKEDREYDVTADVNYKKYFENSGLLSCTYTKKFKIEPSAVVAVVVGIIGGVTSGCTFLAQVLYLVLKVFAVGSARQ